MTWAWPYFDQVLQEGDGEATLPTSLEVSFSHTCNFKCAYCGPEASSSWMNEIKTHGAYPTSTPFGSLEELVIEDKLPLDDEQINPYKEAFWRWWPELYPSLHTFRLTGGEPLLHTDTFKLLDWVEQNPQPHLNFSINTNLGVAAPLFERFLQQCQAIQKRAHLKSLSVYTSCEAHGEKAEFIRDGLNYHTWLERCHQVLQADASIKLVIMATYNLLSYTSFLDFLKDIEALKTTYPGRVQLDTPYLRTPHFLSPLIAPDEYLVYLQDQMKFMSASPVFDEVERNALLRLFHVVKTYSSPVEPSYKDFILFLDEYEFRRDKKFLAVFPEMNDFYYHCRELK